MAKPVRSKVGATLCIAHVVARFVCCAPKNLRKKSTFRTLVTLAPLVTLGAVMVALVNGAKLSITFGSKRISLEPGLLLSSRTHKQNTFNMIGSPIPAVETQSCCKTRVRSRL